jgi:NADPH-dependent 2,4-dienoyl-CoA reductase/sulfur reductase-like enzyme
MLRPSREASSPTSGASGVFNRVAFGTSRRLRVDAQQVTPFPDGSGPKVAVLGGGVAGMSAAHELIERGFRVAVFERQAELCGGKARSIPVPVGGPSGNCPDIEGAAGDLESGPGSKLEST